MISAKAVSYMEAYRSGHNEAVLKTVWGQPHGGSNPSASASALEHYVPRLFSFLSLGHRFHAVACATTIYQKRFHKSRDYSGLYDFKLITFYVGFSLLTAYQFLICRDSKSGEQKEDLLRH